MYSSFKTQVKPFEEKNIKIYAYTLPEVPSHDGSIKVGETTRDAEKRIQEQLSTAGLKANILFVKDAKKINGDWFHDKELHRFFVLNKIENKDFGTGASEWFYFNGNPERAEKLTDDFINMDYSNVQIDENYSYLLRKEQRDAVSKTLDYFNENFENSEFLWNAKPRFGKTLTTYDLVRQLNFKKVLIVTNRPAIANSWFEDFQKFISWQEKDLKFVSDSESLKGKALIRKDFTLYLLEHKNSGCICFTSLQDLKGAKIFGGQYDKLEWIASLDWDLLVIDEAHEGIDTFKTDKAFSRINRKHTLHLSGTPFKAIANNKFTENQIYNWSYADEQQSKMNWNIKDGTNPYEKLPTLNLFTYQMSTLIQDNIKKGARLEDDQNVDYTFDLNEFFSVENEKFKYEESVIKFLDNLSMGKLPFSEKEYRHKLNHTFWLLPRVAAAKAMEKLLKNHSVFKDYHIVLCAGDGKSLVDDEIDNEDTKQVEKSYDRVKHAISKYDRTITLSVGQLTTGVTIPEWTAVFMLSNIKSPALYFQSAFRAQNPYEFKDENGNLLRKENAYIFDFAPERTLTLFDEFANNLSTGTNKNTTEGRKENIRELLNFFPVIGEDENGSMYELSAEDVLTIPNALKSKEVVKRGFMSNLLFANISAIFRAPSQLLDIVNKLNVENIKNNLKQDIKVTEPMLNEDGEVEIPRDIVISTSTGLFGDAIYKFANDTKLDIYNLVDNTEEEKEVDKKAVELVKIVTDSISPQMENLKERFELNKTKFEHIEKEISKELKREFSNELESHRVENENLNTNFEKEIENVETKEEKEEIEFKYDQLREDIKQNFENRILETVTKVYEETVEKQIEKEEKEKKKSTEDEVRDKLRGFSRTIPAFLMAYGDSNTTLSNFENNIDEDTFIELTSITINEFKMLRDGFEYVDEYGENKRVPGLFDEVVFNASVKEFFELKSRLSNYLDNEENEDIFDYIPPQKTNQIFTPRSVVTKMVNMLEENEKDIFKNKDYKFVDFYSKSGIYMAEIGKRLYKGLENTILDKNERIKHILENQLYLFTPTNIIYNMVKNYIYGEFDFIDRKNTILCDTQKEVERQNLEEKIKEIWGEQMKFDVIIGNPPYQEMDNDAGKGSAKPLYQNFITETKKLSPTFISYIIPSVWFNGGKGLENFRKEMLTDKHLKKIVHYNTSQDIFPNVSLRGGVNYFLWEKSIDNNNFVEVTIFENKKIKSKDKRLLKIENLDILIIDNIGCKLLERLFNEGIFKNPKDSLMYYISSRNPYGFETTYTKNENYKNNTDGMISPVKIYSSRGSFGYVERKEIKKNVESIDKLKVVTPFANNIGTNLSDDNLNSFISEKNSIVTETYLTICEELELTELMCNSIISYLKTKFVRFMIMLAKANQNGTRITYQFVPMQDFTANSDIDWSKSIEEIDEQLFEKYGLSQEEREHIKNSIKEMK